MLRFTDATPVLCPRLIETKRQCVSVCECQLHRENTATDFSRFSIAANQQPAVFHQREQTVIIKAFAKKTTALGGFFFGFESKTQMTDLVSHLGT